MKLETPRPLYMCDICGKRERWGRSWRRYSSIAHDETCPDEVPTVCSEKCMNELTSRLSNRSVELPKLKMTAGYFKISKPRKGY